MLIISLRRGPLCVLTDMLWWGIIYLNLFGRIGGYMEDKKMLCTDKKKLPGLIREVVEERFNAKVLDINFLGGGSFGFAYKVDIDSEPSAIVVKTFKVEGMHKKEAYQLDVLREHSTVKFPKVYFTHDNTPDKPLDCMAMEFVEGRDAFNNFGLLFKSQKAKRAFADKLTEGMHSIHCCTADKFGDVENPTFDSWQEYYKPFVDDVFNKAAKMHECGKLEDYVFNTMKKAYLMYDEIFADEVTTPCLIHGDLNVMNVMVKKPFEISAIIDPLNSMYADKEYDLFQLNNLTGRCFGLYKTYKKKYETSEKCDLKCAFYALWNEVYCYIKTGTAFRLIMYPIVRNMNRQMKKLARQS